MPEASKPPAISRNVSLIVRSSLALGALGPLWLTARWATQPIDWQLVVTSLLFASLLATTLFTARALRRVQRAANAATASELKFSQAFRALPDAVAITEVQGGRLVDVNDAFQRLFDWSREEVLGQTSIEIGLWPDPNERELLAKEISTKGSAHDCPATLRRRDGSPVPALVSAEVIELAGRPCFVVAVRDISERLRAERALRESEEKFSKAFHASAEAISISTASGVFLDVNHGYEMLIGRTRAEVAGRTALEIDLWWDPAMRAPMFEKMQRDGTLRDYPIEVKNKAGEKLNVLFSAHFIELGGELHVVSAARDVTEQGRAEALLKQSEERFRLLVEHAPDAIVVFDIDNDRFIAANPAAERLFGSSEAELAKLSPLGVSPERQADGRSSKEAAQGYLAEALAGGRPRFDWLHRHSDGHDVPCEVRLLRLPDPTRTLVRGSILDVSEQRRAELAAAQARAQSEAAIRKLNAELEQRVLDRTAQLTAANAELESFSYSVSHDLRSPLRAIDGFSKALEEDYGAKLDAEGLDYLRRVRAAVQHMGQLIDDLLQLSRASRQDLNRTRVDLRELAREVEHELRERYPERSLAFSVESSLIVQADRTLSRVIVWNLLDNAWKYTRKRKDASVVLGRLGTPDEDGNQVFFVRDNGAGFDMRYASKLFSPFQRLHGKSEFEGTGIGLATVRRIVARHGGRTWAESVVDEGTIVYFTLSGAPE